MRSAIYFRNIGIRNGYDFEASMARPHPKSGRVPPPPPRESAALKYQISIRQIFELKNRPQGALEATLKRKKFYTVKRIYHLESQYFTRGNITLDLL